MILRALLLFLTLLSSCSLLPRAAPTPVPTQTSGNPNGHHTVIFLPGRWSRIDEFENEGFLRIAAARWPEARLIVADLHLGYYQNRSMARRLHEDIVAPARRSGARHVSLVGVSMGGLGALVHELEFPGEVDEIFLLSPYLGKNPALREIEAAGGLASWKPGPVHDEDFTRKLWKGLLSRRSSSIPLPPISLGCGESDRLADSNRLFAREFVPASRQLWVSGGHDWPAWCRILENSPAIPPTHTRNTPRNPRAL